MRTWRVGTFSMGTALLALGVFLLLFNFDKDVSVLLLSWWPIIFIILGVEIIIYLFMRKEENPTIKYDVFSIFFIAFLGTAGLIFVFVSGIGITDEVKAAITSKEATFDLPIYTEKVEEKITNIVVEDASHQLTIESTSSDEISLFGTYRTNDVDEIKELEEYASIKTVGDTLYLTFKELPARNGWNHGYMRMKAMLIIPSHVSLEVRGRSDKVILRPESIQANWIVEDARNVSIHAMEEDHLTIRALNVDYLQGYEVDWEIQNETEEEEDVGQLEGEIHLGNGESKIEIIHAHEASTYLN